MASSWSLAPEIDTLTPAGIAPFDISAPITSSRTISTPVSSGTDDGGMMFRVTVRWPLMRRTELVSTVSSIVASADRGKTLPCGV